MKRSCTFNLRLALLASLWCAAARAQETSSWVKVAPPGEAFTVLMPRKPAPAVEKRKHGALSLTGKRYSERGADDTIYTVWSFKGGNLPAALRSDTESYLDLCAELAWEMIVEPERAKAARELSIAPETRYELTYAGESRPPDYPGRSYRLSLGTQSGTTIVRVAGSRFYIVAAWNPDRVIGKMDEFLNSFTLHPPVRAGRAATGAGEGAGPGVNESVSGVTAKKETKETKETADDRTFKMSEVTRKASILSKPAPSYTEWARKFGVTGAVRLRLVLSASGTVSSITPIKRLPHGLTREAVEAARKIKFRPAEKDGRPVSQYVTVEYNFNIY